MRVSADGQRVELRENPSYATRIFDLQTGRELPNGLAEAHNSGITCFAVAPDGKIVTAGYDNTTRVWDSVSGRQLNQFTANSAVPSKGRLRAIALSPDGKLVALGTATEWSSAAL